MCSRGLRFDDDGSAWRWGRTETRLAVRVGVMLARGHADSTAMIELAGGCVAVAGATSRSQADIDQHEFNELLNDVRARRSGGDGLWKRPSRCYGIWREGLPFAGRSR